MLGAETSVSRWGGRKLRRERGVASSPLEWVRGGRDRSTECPKEQPSLLAKHCHLYRCDKVVRRNPAELEMD